MGIFCTAKDMPIVLYRGDDTDFIGNQSIRITIKTELDISGCSVHFDLLGLRRVITELDEDKSFVLNFSRDDTKDFPIGKVFASLWLVDEASKRRTVADNIKFIITNNAQLAYHASEQFITLVMEGSIPNVKWSNVTDKPTTLAGYGITDAVKTVNGVAPDENGNVNVQVSSIPIATADTLGGVKVGSGLSVTQDGTLSADAPAHDNTKLDAESAAEAWDGEIYSYEQGEVVSYNGKLYKCINDVGLTTTPPPEDQSHWEAYIIVDDMATMKADMDAKLNELAAASGWTNTTWNAGDCVVYSGNFYVCEVAAAAATNKAPPDDLYNSTTQEGHWLEIPIIELVKTLLQDKLDLAGGTMTGNLVAPYVEVSDMLQVGATGPITIDGENHEIIVGGTTIADGVIQTSGGNYSFDGSGGSVAVLAQIGVKAFNTSTAYAVGDHLIYATTAGNETTYSLYRCTAAHSAGAWDATHFTKVADLNTAAPASGGTSLITNGQVFAALALKANAADLRYALVTKTIENDAVTLDDRASNVVVVPTPASGATEVTLTLNLPAAVSGRARDLLVRLDLTHVPTTGVDISGISFAPASGETATFEVKGNAWPENEVGKVNLWSLTETNAGKWAVGRETLTTVTQGGGS